MTTQREPDVRRARQIDPPPVIPVGASEIAQVLGVGQQAVYNWNQDRIHNRAPVPMPPPAWTVANRDAWNLVDVLSWAKRANRLPPGVDPMHRVKDWPYRHELCPHGVRYKGRGAPKGKATMADACPECPQPEALT